MKWLGHKSSFEYVDPGLLVVTVNLYCYVLFNITDTTQILPEQDVFSSNAVFFYCEIRFLNEQAIQYIQFIL